jgi:alkyl hydroperoxide reductase subunit AhpF
MPMYPLPWHCWQQPYALGEYAMTQQAIISDRDKTQLKRTLRKDLKANVRLKLFTQRPSPIAIPGRECPYCPQTEQLMQELAGLSPKLDLDIVDFYAQPEVAREFGIDKVPATVIGDGKAARIKFYGIPMGYELATVIEDIKTVSRGVSPLSMDTRKRLRQVNQPVHLQVFVTPA